MKRFSGESSPEASGEPAKLFAKKKRSNCLKRLSGESSPEASGEPAKLFAKKTLQLLETFKWGEQDSNQ